MKFGSLFSGIGGLDLGLERAGMECIWQSEVDAFCNKVLAKHWPSVPNLGDVTTIDWSEVERPDLICGGYPCQPFSLAGARRGTGDERHLWPYFASAIRVLRPEWALLENVPGHLSLGLGDVQSDLAELGYDTEWECIPAAAVGAPHLRYRLVIVAHSNEQRRGQIKRDLYAGQPNAARRSEDPDADGSSRWRHADGLCDEVADAEGESEWPGLLTGDEGGIGRGRFADGGGEADRGHWAIEPDVGRVADGIPGRVDRLKSLGNAVVPQMAEWVGRRIMEAAR